MTEFHDYSFPHPDLEPALAQLEEVVGRKGATVKAQKFVREVSVASDLYKDRCNIQMA